MHREEPFILLNHMILSGRVATDPETYKPTNYKYRTEDVAKFLLIQDRRIPTRDGSERWGTIKIWCQAYIDPARAIVQTQIKKGDEVVARGKLNYYEYTNQSGEKKKVHELYILEIQINKKGYYR